MPNLILIPMITRVKKVVQCQTYIVITNLDQALKRMAIRMAMSQFRRRSGMST